MWPWKFMFQNKNSIWGKIYAEGAFLIPYTRKFMKHSYYGLIKKVGKIIWENEGA